MKKSGLNSLILTLLLAPPTSAIAQYSSSIDRGLTTQKFLSPSGPTEECVVGRRFPNWTYPSDEFTNRAIENEAALCNLDFYTKGPEIAGICPKLGSTNPGILLFDLDGQDKFTFEKSQCHQKRVEGELVAKFKSSVSCSYTPSILSYYHLSQMFGGLLHIPETAIRTMAISTHKALREQALDFLQQLGLQNATISKTWRDSWGLAYKNPTSDRGDRVFSKDGQQVYGALIVNPLGEEKYSEVYGRWKDYDKRFEAMTAQIPYQNIIDPTELRHRLTTTPTAESLQVLVQMRDVTDMLILDYILGQTDRPGNIHYYNMIYQSEDGLEWKKTRANSNEELAPSRYSFEIKEMLLKDNDCGIVKGNLTKKYGLLDDLRHISPSTYKNVLRLAQMWENEDDLVSHHAAVEWLFTPRDIRVIKNDLLSLRDKLYQDCRSGKLQLDLDLKRHYSGAGSVESCNL